MFKSTVLIALVASASAFAPSAGRAFSRSIAVQAEEAAPWDSWGSDDYGPEIAKLQSEAEERLEKKISELMANIETTGTK
eukprot:CAMPEP_0116040524 /NCGR_PEP_ID=MMETSP0321-20121206/24416_1 /TAXON_ID=163516 /ORGANISM="Leptocylindrus danicus var. danicus, Strain B650" /LENGTH=79 /DNA_ID=CAMNT_0003520367 /DNA_START=38 /DNA_END=277 /DNA_ORIENTATION=+